MSENNIFGQAPEKKEKTARFNKDNEMPQVAVFNKAQIQVGNRDNTPTQRFAVALHEAMKEGAVGTGAQIPSTGVDGSDRAAAKDIANRVNELCEAYGSDIRAKYFKISECNYAVASYRPNEEEEEESGESE